ncbi:MAG: hypothetical protein ACFFD4_18305 [Candidatus Odinarchaeota archaeon]
MGPDIRCSSCGEKNSTDSTRCKKCGSKLPLTEESASFTREEQLDPLERERRERSKIFFNVQKSGSIEETYRISYPDDRAFITARRSAFNRIGLYAFFLIASILIVLWGFINVFITSPDFEVVFTRYLTAGIIQFLLILSLIVIINTFIDVRRITVYSEDGPVIGRIKGSLLFTRWHISGPLDVNNTTFRFGLFRSKGKMKTYFGSSFTLTVIRETTLVNDVNGEFYFSVQSLDSVYIRKRFRIDSTDQLNPLLICLASVCIIERLFKPKARPD